MTLKSIIGNSSFEKWVQSCNCDIYTYPSKKYNYNEVLIIDSVYFQMIFLRYDVHLILRKSDEEFESMDVSQIPLTVEEQTQITNFMDNH